MKRFTGVRPRLNRNISFLGENEYVIRIYILIATWIWNEIGDMFQICRKFLLENCMGYVYPYLEWLYVCLVKFKSSWTNSCVIDSSALKWHLLWKAILRLVLNLNSDNLDISFREFYMALEPSFLSMRPWRLYETSLVALRMYSYCAYYPT